MRDLAPFFPDPKSDRVHIVMSGEFLALQDVLNTLELVTSAYDDELRHEQSTAQALRAPSDNERTTLAVLKKA